SPPSVGICTPFWRRHELFAVRFAHRRLPRSWSVPHLDVPVAAPDGRADAAAMGARARRYAHRRRLPPVATRASAARLGHRLRLCLRSIRLTTWIRGYISELWPLERS